jgi:hypothetical protein
MAVAHMSRNTGETFTHILHVNPEYTEHLKLCAVWRPFKAECFVYVEQFLTLKKLYFVNVLNLAVSEDYDKKSYSHLYTAFTDTEFLNGALCVCVFFFFFFFVKDKLSLSVQF